MISAAKSSDMTEGPFLKKILLFALPLAASSVLQLLFNAADVVVVGRFAGSAALAAVGSNGSLINLLVNLFVGLSVGSNVVAARAFGARDAKAVSKTVHTSILISFIGGVILAVVGVLCARTLLEWMSSPADVIDLAALYLRIYFVGMPVMMIYNFGSALLRAIGDTRRPLICLAISGLLNIVLNLVFVINFHMSVAGVALATVISQALSAVMVLIILIREEGPLHLDLRELRIWPDVLRQILQIGVPAGIQGTLFSFSNVIIQSGINSFGSTVVAGSSAASNIESFIYVSMNSCHQACVTFTSQNVGARREENISRVLRCSMASVIGIGLVLGIGATLAGAPLLSIYSTDAAVIAAGLRRMRVICSAYALCGIMDVWVGSLRGMGYSILPMLVSLIGSCLFRILYIATVFAAFHSEPVLYLCYPISWLLTLTAHAVCYAVVRRIRARRLAAAG